MLVEGRRVEMSGGDSSCPECAWIYVDTGEGNGCDLLSEAGDVWAVWCDDTQVLSFGDLPTPYGYTTAEADSVSVAEGLYVITFVSSGVLGISSELPYLLHRLCSYAREGE
jgi:hypothetical protein